MISLGHIARVAHAAGLSVRRPLIGVPATRICPPNGWSGCDWTPREDDRWTICIWENEEWSCRWMLDHNGRLVR